MMCWARARVRVRVSVRVRARARARARARIRAKIWHATTKARCSQINKIKKKIKNMEECFTLNKYGPIRE